MTISTTGVSITYLGNGATTAFTFPFVGVAAADIFVSITSPTGTITQLTGTQYTLVVNAIPVGGLWGIGGTVTYPNVGSPLPVGWSLTIQRSVPFQQTVSINNQGAFYPQTVEQGLDLLELQIQQINAAILRAIQVPIVDLNPQTILPPAASRANGILAFDNNGNVTIIPAVGGNIPVPVTLGFAAPRKITTTGTATINILSSDSFGGVSVYQSSTPVTTLQLPSGFGPFPVFDGSLNAGTFPITVLPPGGLTILGQANYKILTNGSSPTFFNDGTQILIQ